MPKKLYLDKQLMAANAAGDAKPLLVDDDGRLYTLGYSSALPTGAATSAKQDALIALMPAALSAGGGVKTGLVDSLPSGGNVIGKTGYNLKRISASFSRPSDTTAYAIGDAISNSTSAPTVFELDLSTIGAVAGQAVEIRKLAVVSRVKQSLLPLINVFLSSTTFTATNDNSALSIDDTTMETGGSWFNCDLQNSTSLNSRVAYSGAPQPIVLASDDTKLYGAMQAANAYVPASGEKFTILAWIALL